MIVNHTYRYIFIHIPRTSGSTVTEYLDCATCSWQDIQIGVTEFGEAVQEHYLRKYHLRKHIPAFHLRSIVGEDIWREYFTFAVVRNPYDRFISCYNYLITHSQEGFPYFQYAQGFSDVNAFAETADLFSPNVPDYMLLPQCYWVGDRGDYKECRGIVIDKCIRFEFIEKELNAVLEKIGIKGSFSPQISFNEIDRSNLAQVADLSTQAIHRLNNVYCNDFHLLGYPMK